MVGPVYLVRSWSKKDLSRGCSTYYHSIFHWRNYWCNVGTFPSCCSHTILPTWKQTNIDLPINKLLWHIWIGVPHQTFCNSLGAFQISDHGTDFTSALFISSNDCIQKLLEMRMQWFWGIFMNRSMWMCFSNHFKVLSHYYSRQYIRICCIIFRYTSLWEVEPSSLGL